MRAVVCVCAPRDLTLLFKPCGYHGAGCLIWPLESKSKESGLCRAACAHKHTHRKNVEDVCLQRCREHDPEASKTIPTKPDYPEAPQQTHASQSPALPLSLRAPSDSCFHITVNFIF